MNPFLVRVRFEPGLQVKGGKLLGPGERGDEVHAASFLRKRLIVLNAALLSEPAELKRIWVHELFHFVWWRLPNERRRSWEQLLARELQDGAAGELGWSAEWRKNALSVRDREQRTRRWREYCCESFCDSAAWWMSCIGRHGEFTLPRPFRGARRRWFLGELRYNSGSGII